ncbi:MAG: hypothetical protein RLZZ591_1245 [Pseudomonadota bacterium]|jgi:hypothetical protein
MSARELEAELVNRCTVAARETAPTAQNQREASVFQLAAVVVRSQFPKESTRLMLASEQYFASHPNERLMPGEIVRNGWVMSMPRLRDMLSRQLYNH